MQEAENNQEPIPPKGELRLEAQPGSPSSAFRTAQHSKSLEKPSVSRSWGWQELNVCTPQLLLFRIFTQGAKKASLLLSGVFSGQEGPLEGFSPRWACYRGEDTET